MKASADTLDRLSLLADLASIPRGESLDKPAARRDDLVRRFRRLFPTAVSEAPDGAREPTSASKDQLVGLRLARLHDEVHTTIVAALDGAIVRIPTPAPGLVKFDTQAGKLVELVPDETDARTMFLRRVMTPGRFPFRRCDYEPCGVVFVSNKGARFCSADHRLAAFNEPRRAQRAEYMRELRKRKKAEKETNEERKGRRKERS